MEMIHHQKPSGPEAPPVHDDNDDWYPLPSPLPDDVEAPPSDDKVQPKPNLGKRMKKTFVQNFKQEPVQNMPVHTL